MRDEAFPDEDSSRGDDVAAPSSEFPAGVLVNLCLILEERCWRYYDEARREWVGYDFTPQLAALGWLPEAQHLEAKRDVSLWQ